MSGYFWLVAAFPLAFATLGAAPPTQAATLEPAGDWQVDQAAESCRLRRDFGSGTERATFNINSYGSDDAYRLVVMGDQVPRDGDKSHDAMINFGPDGDTQPIIAIAGRLGDEGMLSMLMIGPRPVYHFVRGYSVVGRFDAERTVVSFPQDVTSFTIETGRMPALTLNLGDMAGALDMLRQCQERLTASWGVAPAAMAPGATLPSLADNQAIFSGLAMPQAMVLNHVSIMAQIRVLVDADGEATSCVVQSPPLDRRQQRGLCNPFLNGAEFTPAQDAEGNAIASVFRGVYTYFIFD